MRDRSRELDMAHALAPNPRQRHLDAALLADDALILHALVLAAQALLVLDRPEDARAEQSVAFGLERAVVDGLTLLADDALILHALVLAAQALVVLDRPEDARAEQSVAFGLERAVVDGLRLL